MHTFLHQKLIDNLYTKLDLETNTSILLAISSGQDSLCLLRLILDLQKNSAFRFGIIHIDHQCRSDSTYNATHLVNIIKHLNVQSYIYQLNPKKYSEHALRELRYEIFMTTALNNCYDTIATAHTLSDQTETCLFNMIKGGGLDIVNSLTWKRNLYNRLQLIRPILNFDRSEITWLCRYYSLPVWFDYTNIYYTYNRNRIRHEIIPYLKEYYQIDIERSLGKFLENLYNDSEYLRQNTLKGYLKVKHPKYLAINYHQMIKQHVSLQVRILQLFLVHHTQIRPSSKLLYDLLKTRKYNRPIYIKNVSVMICTKNQWIYIC
uniref:tRNA(Ile)-lysidine synthase, chloroplastic n=1 Tax=Helminthocladia australis TaxID=260093 RepID=A0A1G4NTM3_9FLOR|nr:tRNA Ile-lysidine synthetase [Helminthocladia australis]SCW21906.1 tRNA Ile-lysidine synthetase [Helminthocladia australis]